MSWEGTAVSEQAACFGSERAARGETKKGGAAAGSTTAAPGRGGNRREGSRLMRVPLEHRGEGSKRRSSFVSAVQRRASGREGQRGVSVGLSARPPAPSRRRSAILASSTSAIDPSPDSPLHVRLIADALTFANTNLVATERGFGGIQPNVDNSEESRSHRKLGQFRNTLLSISTCLPPRSRGIQRFARPSPAAGPHTGPRDPPTRSRRPARRRSRPQRHPPIRLVSAPQPRNCPRAALRRSSRALPPRYARAVRAAHAHS
jgi:hypothetical protein